MTEDNRRLPDTHHLPISSSASSRNWGSSVWSEIIQRNLKHDARSWEKELYTLQRGRLGHLIFLSGRKMLVTSIRRLMKRKLINSCSNRLLVAAAGGNQFRVGCCFSLKFRCFIAQIFSFIATSRWLWVLLRVCSSTSEYLWVPLSSGRKEPRYTSHKVLFNQFLWRMLLYLRGPGGALLPSSFYLRSPWWCAM